MVSSFFIVFFNFGIGSRGSTTARSKTLVKGEKNSVPDFVRCLKTMQLSQQFILGLLTLNRHPFIHCEQVIHAPSKGYKAKIPAPVEDARILKVARREVRRSLCVPRLTRDLRLSTTLSVVRSCNRIAACFGSVAPQSQGPPRVTFTKVSPSNLYRPPAKPNHNRPLRSS